MIHSTYARIVREGKHPVWDVLGPTVQFMTAPVEAGQSFCVLTGRTNPLAQS